MTDSSSLVAGSLDTQPFTPPAGQAGRARGGLLAPMILAFLTVGCSSSSPGLFNSWLDPIAVGNFTREGTLEIRTSLSIQDTSWGIPGASEPTPDDLAPHPEEYRFTAGDAMAIRIFELFASNTEAMLQPTIDEVGNIRLPLVGTVLVTGLTARELEDELKDILAQKGIIQDAQVVVEPLIRRHNTYTVFGATGGPNIYPLPMPDFRLLDALSISGGLAEQVLDIYVFRDEPVEPEAPGPVERALELEGLEEPPAEGDAQEPEAAPTYLTGGLGEPFAGLGDWQQPPPAGGGAPAGNTAAQQPPPSQPATDRETQDLLEAVAPGQEAWPEVATQPAAEEAAPARSRWVFLNGKWIEVQPEAAEEAAPPPGSEWAEEAIEAPPDLPQPAVDWDSVAGETTRRIIHVAADALRNGDPRYNIVIRPRDTIRLQVGEIGEYYMMGQINRPGIYSLSGRELTLKAAIAGAGNLGALAWPERCTVYRRLGDREEMIQVNLNRLFSGDDPDFYIRKNDLILVGTHPAAIFLAVLRNAFRITYGFGFVYDRNFADVDNVERQVKAQLRARDEYEADNQFPGLF